MPRTQSSLAAIGAGLVLLLAACTSGGTAPTSSPASASEAASESAAASEAESAAASEAASEDESAAPAGDGETVMLEGFEFAPTELMIPAGTTVTFMNMDTAPHTATHGTDGAAEADALFDLQLDADGGTDEFTFDEPGTYNVTCTIHPAMNMVITVE